MKTVSEIPEKLYQCRAGWVWQKMHAGRFTAEDATRAVEMSGGVLTASLIASPVGGDSPRYHLQNSAGCYVQYFYPDRDLIYVTERGYYDTADEKSALLANGSVVELLDPQPGQAPCKSKQGKGLWGNATCLNTGNRKTVFIEDGNFSKTNPK